MRSLLIILLLFAIGANVIWIILDQSPPLWDMAGHSARAASFGDSIAGFHPKAVLFYDTIYPPAAYLFTGAWFTIFGKYADIPQLSLQAYVLLLLLSTYGIAKRLLKKRSAGILAVFLLTAFPLAAHFMRIYDLDIPLTALVTTSVYVLLRTNGFLHRGWVITLAVAAAIGMLTKWTFVIFFLGPFLAYWWQHRFAFGTRVGWKHTLLFFTLGALILLPWYSVHLVDVLSSSVETRFNGFSVPFEDLFSIANARYYPGTAISGMTWPLALIVTAGIGLAFFKRKRADVLLLSWGLLPYLIMTFALYSKESRYFLPVYPAFALLGAAALTSIGTRGLRVSLTTLTIVVGTFFWAETSWNLRAFPQDTYLRLGFQRQYGYFHPTYEVTGYGFPYPTQHHTILPEVAQAIQDDNGSRNGDVPPINIIVVPNSIYLTSQQIQFYGNLVGMNADYQYSSTIRFSEYTSVLPKADYIVIKTGHQGPGVWAPKALDTITKHAAEKKGVFTKQFERVGAWTLLGIEKQPQEVWLYRTNR